MSRKIKDIPISPLLEKTVLKPCPFCGGKAELIMTSTGYGTNEGRAFLHNEYIVRCIECDIHTPVFKSDIWQDRNGDVIVIKNGAENAKDAWNRRVTE